MNQQRYGGLHLVLLLAILSAYLPSGFAQTSNSTASDTVKRTMATVLAHCHMKSDGIEMITFIPPSNEEFETIKSLGAAAIEPLSIYLEAREDGGFTQLFAVKFLTALRNPSALAALQRAFDQDQWEVTRMAALAGMFETSKAAAELYVEAALEDTSPVVRHMAESLWAEYKPH